MGLRLSEFNLRCLRVAHTHTTLATSHSENRILIPIPGPESHQCRLWDSAAWSGCVVIQVKCRGVCLEFLGLCVEKSSRVREFERLHNASVTNWLFAAVFLAENTILSVLCSVFFFFASISNLYFMSARRESSTYKFMSSPLNRQTVRNFSLRELFVCVFLVVWLSAFGLWFWSGSLGFFLGAD